MFRRFSAVSQVATARNATASATQYSGFCSTTSPSLAPTAATKTTVVTRGMLKRPAELDVVAASVQARQKERERETQQNQATNPLSVANASRARMPQKPAAVALSSFLSSSSAKSRSTIPTTTTTTTADAAAAGPAPVVDLRAQPTVVLTKVQALAKKAQELDQKKAARKMERKVANMTQEELDQMAELDSMNIAVQTEAKKKPWKYVKPAKTEAMELGVSVEEVKNQRKAAKKLELAKKTQAKKALLSSITVEESEWAIKTLTALDSEWVPQVNNWINETGRDASFYSLFERRVWAAVSQVPEGRAASYGVIGLLVKAASELVAEVDSGTEEFPTSWKIIQDKEKAGDWDAPENKEFRLTCERTPANTLKNLKALNMTALVTREATVALYKCPIVRAKVPTHRCVKSSGELSGVSPARDDMRSHLEQEGVKFVAPLPSVVIPRTHILSFTVERRPKPASATATASAATTTATTDEKEE